MDKTTSKIITAIRFPLIAAVVTVHSNIIQNPTAASSELYCTFTDIFFGNFLNTSIALFFFISGYLFFHESTFSARLYKKKLVGRVRSLLVPYVLWNLIYFAVVLLMQNLFSGFSLLLHKQIADFSLSDYFYVFWNVREVTGLSTDQASPLVSQFWFLQCLMVFSVLSPIFYYAIKKTGIVVIVCLLVLVMMDVVPDVPGFKTSAFYYMALGAYFAIAKIRWYTDNARVYLYLAIAWAAVFAVRLWMPLNWLWLAQETLLLFLVFGLVYRLTKGRKLSKRVVSLCGSSFFVFAVHIFFTPIGRGIASRLPLANGWEAIACFFVVAAFSIGCSVACYKLLDRVMPRVVRVLCGDRH